VYGWIAGLYVFCVCWSDFFLLPYQVQFTRPLAVLGFATLLLSLRIDNRVRRIGFPIVAMLAFVMLVPAHFLTSEDTVRTGRRLLSYFGLFIMALFLQQAIRTFEAYRMVLGSFVAGCAVTLVGLAWNVMNGVAMGDGRYSAPGWDPNDLAGQIALSIPIASYLAFTRARSSICFRLYLPLAVVGILLTASRAGLVALLAAAVFPIFCLLRSTSLRVRIGVIVALILSAVAVYYAAPTIQFDRLSTIGDELSRRDLNGRGAIWNHGMQLFWANPVFGIGAGAFAGAVTGSVRTAAHNSYLEVLVEHGAIGLVLFLSIIAGLLVRAQRYPLDQRILWWVMLGSWGILAFTLSWENREITWVVWALCASFVPKPVKPAVTGKRPYAA
jgi:O-antigen ligase